METFIAESLLFLRVGLAAVLGFIIGLERKSKYKEAGIRTHALVCAGSALMMVISRYGFGDSGADQARVAAQIVTGIGFLGAGIIVYRKQVLRGLTTAAGVWMTAGIGMAAGAGQFYLAVFSAALILLIHTLLSLNIPAFKSKRFFGIKILFVCTDAETETVKELFNVKRFSNVEYKKEGDHTNVTAEVYTQNFIDDEVILKILRENDFISAIKRIVE